MPKDIRVKVTPQKHPDLRKLARALLLLVQERQTQQPKDKSSAPEVSSLPTGCHRCSAARP